MDPVEQVAGLARQAALDRPRVMVAIDGRDAAGKTVFADRLARSLPHSVRASVDDWLRPPEVRYRRGELSPDGYFEEAFDYDALVSELVDPFRRGSTRLTLMREGPAVRVPRTAVLLLDGVFLLRHELREYWDVSVYLRITAEESLAQALRRDATRFGSAAVAEVRYQSRYLPAQRRYLAEADPEAHADIVIDNSSEGVVNR